MNNSVKFIKTEFPGFVRDTRNSAIINTDNESFKTYKQIRDERLKTLALAQEVSVLKNDLGEIKDMLRALLGK